MMHCCRPSSVTAGVIPPLYTLASPRPIRAALKCRHGYDTDALQPSKPLVLRSTLRVHAKFNLKLFQAVTAAAYLDLGPRCLIAGPKDVLTLVSLSIPTPNARPRHRSAQHLHLSPPQPVAGHRAQTLDEPPIHRRGVSCKLQYRSSRPETDFSISVPLAV